VNVRIVNIMLATVAGLGIVALLCVQRGRQVLMQHIVCAPHARYAIVPVRSVRIPA
jgi:hypothetical protein